MEGLVQKFKLMKAEAWTYQNVKLLPQSKGMAAKQLELLNQDYVWEMLMHFDTAGVHYWHTEFMKFMEFYNTMLSSYGGTCIHNMTGVQEIRNPSSLDWSMVFAQYGLEVLDKMQEQVDAMVERGNLSCVAFITHPNVYSRVIIMVVALHIILIIFESYLAFLIMEGQLSTLNVPDHLLSQLELLGIFGMSLSSGSKLEKLSMSKKGKAKKMDEEEYGDQEYMDGQDEDKKDSDKEEEDMSAKDNEDQDMHEKEKVKAEAWAKSLEMEATQASKILMNSRKVSSPALTYCDKAWRHMSKISSEAIANSFHACAIHHYCLTLLSDPAGSATAIHFKIETNTAIFQITCVSTHSIQTTLNQPKQHPSNVAITLTWPDSIASAKLTVNAFNLHTELSRHNQAILHLTQQTQIQCVITCVKSQHVAWEDMTNTVLAWDRPPLEEAVQQALEHLVLTWFTELIKSTKAVTIPTPISASGNCFMPLGDSAKSASVTSGVQHPVEEHHSNDTPMHEEDVSMEIVEKKNDEEKVFI
ncbi:hypothetical protein PISMIDRAFT_22878 [Pisolithus microcarpus 441]|uniref:Uncharacterized protein n=1 Tax=Pisolithus microcarpus 441 TaxID=765257 RepID=A0A0C9ZH41_9AGAM|nr:hypothetical protein BKA83DRAFT_22878 [Pisolithus microcarpus]KIK25324.1 hypothetical protein PISMIDRAFT_22878 [Pisolithus microcarpus 441]